MNVAAAAVAGGSGDPYGHPEHVWPGWAEYFTSLTAASKLRQRQFQLLQRHSQHQAMEVCHYMVTDGLGIFCFEGW